MAVSTVGSSPIYPCPIRAWIINALVLVRALDWCAIVAVCARADLAAHAVGVPKLGIRSHAYMNTSVRRCVISYMVSAGTYHCVCR